MPGSASEVGPQPGWDVQSASISPPATHRHHRHQRDGRCLAHTCLGPLLPTLLPRSLLVSPDAETPTVPLSPTGPHRELQPRSSLSWRSSEPFFGPHCHLALLSPGPCFDEEAVALSQVSKLVGGRAAGKDMPNASFGDGGSSCARIHSDTLSLQKATHGPSGSSGCGTGGTPCPQQYHPALLQFPQMRRM